jgi:hypothetical protein
MTGPAPVLSRSFESDTRHQGDRIWQLTFSRLHLGNVDVKEPA